MDIISSPKPIKMRKSEGSVERQILPRREHGQMKKYQRRKGAGWHGRRWQESVDMISGSGLNVGKRVDSPTGEESNSKREEKLLAIYPYD